MVKKDMWEHFTDAKLMTFPRTGRNVSEMRSTESCYHRTTVLVAHLDRTVSCGGGDPKVRSYSTVERRFIWEIHSHLRFSPVLSLAIVRHVGHIKLRVSTSHSKKKKSPGLKSSDLRAER